MLVVRFLVVCCIRSFLRYLLKSFFKKNLELTICFSLLHLVLFGMNCLI